MINAHGGKLVNRVTEADPSGLLSIDISADLANDVENIADGIFSPLEGFLNKQDFESVISKGRLVNDIAWTIPTVLDVDDETGKKMKEAGDVLLKNPDGTGIQFYMLRMSTLMINNLLLVGFMEQMMNHILVLQRLIP